MASSNAEIFVAKHGRTWHFTHIRRTWPQYERYDDLDLWPWPFAQMFRPIPKIRFQILEMVCHPWATTCYRQPSTYLYQIWSRYLHWIRRYERRYKMSKMVGFGLVRGYPGPLKIAPFDRAHTCNPVSISQRFLASENYSPCAIVWRCLHDHSRTSTCDGRTDRRTDTWWR